MSKFKLTSPFTLGAIASLGAMSILGAPIGAPLMLGALGLVALGRNNVNAVQTFSIEATPHASHEPVELADNDLSHYDEEAAQDDMTAQVNSEDAADLADIHISNTEQQEQLSSDPDSFISRKLLTNSPTSSPGPLPEYVVNNGNSSGIYSFLAALSYVNSIGGAHNITFGPGAYGKISLLASNTAITTTIPIDLAGLSPLGFTLDGGGSLRYIYSQVTTPTGFTFTSSLKNGTFSLYHSYLRNTAAGSMTINVNDETNFFLLSGSTFWNNAAGNMIINVNEEASISLSSSSFYNSATGALTTNVNEGTSISLNSSHFRNNALGVMLTNIYGGGLLSMDAGAAFYGSAVIVKANATLSMGSGGSYFGGSSLALMPSSTFMAVIGGNSLPMQFMTCPSPSYCTTPKNSTAAIEGATLNIVSYQILNSLQGNNYTIITIADGSSITGNFGLFQFNGSSFNIPYKVYYTPSPTVIKSITVGFSLTPAPTITPTFDPTTASPSHSPSLTPTKEPTLDPTQAPTRIMLATHCKPMSIHPKECAPAKNCTVVYSQNSTVIKAIASPCDLECFMPLNCSVTTPFESYLKPTSGLPILKPSNAKLPWRGYDCGPKEFIGCKASLNTTFPEISNTTNPSIILVKGNVKCSIIIFQCNLTCVTPSTSTAKGYEGGGESRRLLGIENGEESLEEKKEENPNTSPDPQDLQDSFSMSQDDIPESDTQIYSLDTSISSELLGMNQEELQGDLVS